MTSTRTDGALDGLVDPVRRLPAPRAPSVRREVDLEIAPAGEWTDGARVRGRARDVVRDGSGTARTVAETALEVRTDGSWVLLDVEVPGRPGWSSTLLGRVARSGFRAGLADLAGLDADSLDAALLDDLPTVRLIAGYAQLMEAGQPVSGGRPQLDVCSGWRADGAAVERALGGRPLLGRAGPVPAIQQLVSGPADFPTGLPERPRTMRRRRVLELAPGAGGTGRVQAYLRDSHLDAGAVERGLHEYLVSADVAGADLRLSAVVAEPRTLPFADCPLAAPNVDRLAGVPAGDVESAVTGRLAAAAGCTHLNDVLRTFRFLPRLASRIGDRP